MYRTILVPLDGSPNAERALPYAFVLSSAFGARLIVARAVPPGHGAQLDRAVGRLKAMKDAEDYLEALVKGRQRQDTATVAVFDEPSRMIVDEVRRHEIDLVVLAIHRRTGRGAWQYGSVADNVVRRLTVPLVVIPSACTKGWSTGHGIRILVPFDGSRATESALMPAIGLAQATRGAVELLRVVGPEAERRDGNAGPANALAGELAGEVQARSYLEAVRADLHAQLNVVTTNVVVDDRVADAILNVARDHDVAAIALTTRGRSRVGSAGLGHVTAELIARSPVPLLLVQPASMPSVHVAGIGNAVSREAGHVTCASR